MSSQQVTLRWVGCFRTNPSVRQGTTRGRCSLREDELERRGRRRTYCFSMESPSTDPGSSLRLNAARRDSRFSCHRHLTKQMAFMRLSRKVLRACVPRNNRWNYGTSRKCMTCGSVSDPSERDHSACNRDTSPQAANLMVSCHSPDPLKSSSTRLQSM